MRARKLECEICHAPLKRDTVFLLLIDHSIEMLCELHFFAAVGRLICEHRWIAFLQSDRDMGDRVFRVDAAQKF